MSALTADRLSFNQITADRWSLAEVVEACVEHGVGTIGPWRQKIGEVGLDASARLIADAGLAVSSLCRGGFFTDGNADEDNRRAVDEAVALGTDVLVLVCGPPRDRDLRAARDAIAAGIDRLAPYAADNGVRLGIEPLHPMQIGERSAIVTLGEANDLAETIDAEHVGVIVDAYHVWWDPNVEREIARAGARVLGFHVSDWLVPTEHTLHQRGLMGDGVIDLPALRACVERAGYDGPIEVEILNPDVWDLPRDRLMTQVRERFLTCV